MPGTDELQLTTREAAELLGESVRQTIRRVEAGTLKPSRKLPGIRGAYIFDRADVERILSERAA